MYAAKVHTVNMSKWIHIFLICYGGDLVKLFGFAVAECNKKKKKLENERMQFPTVEQYTKWENMLNISVQQ